MPLSSLFRRPTLDNDSLTYHLVDNTTPNSGHFESMEL